MNNITVLYVGGDRDTSNYLGKLSMELNWRLSIIPRKEAQTLGREEADVWLIDLKQAKQEDQLVMQLLLEQPGKKILLAPDEDPEQYFFFRNILPIGYLVRPYSCLQLRSLIEISMLWSDSDQKMLRIMQNWREEEALRSTLYVKHNNKLFKVRQQEILAIMADGNYCVIITPQRRHAVKISLRKIKKKLSGLLFRQIHRNYIVQLSMIDSVDLSTGEVYLRGDAYPIGGSYRQHLMECLERI